MTENPYQEHSKNNEYTINETENSKEIEKASKRFIIIAVITGIIVLALVVAATMFLIREDNRDTTAQIRDIFIIFMALESLIIGIALIILIIQLSTLINLLQNEIKPIINSTNETVNTLKGTAQFVSNHLTEPVIKINQYMAMLKRLVKPSKK